MKNKSKSDDGRMFYSVREVSKKYHINVHTVYALIESGELTALDVRRPGSDRPSFRLSVDALKDFETSHTVRVKKRSKK